MLEIHLFSLLKPEFREGSTAQGYIATELELIWHLVCWNLGLEIQSRRSSFWR